MKKHTPELPLLLELQSEQQDITCIRQQQQLVNKIHNTIQQKDQEIQQLNALLRKYQAYQQKYSSLKVELQDKTHIINRKDTENKLLKRQLEEIIKEAEEQALRSKRGEEEKQKLIKERHALQRGSKETERTFKEYQQECRRREQQSLQDLERAYHTHREHTARIDELQLQLEQTRPLRGHITRLEKELEEQSVTLRTVQQRQVQQEKEEEESPAHRPNFTETDDLSSELLRLQQQLLRQEEENSRQQVLNYELTLEYDQTVSSLCLLESQVSHYRCQNTELRQRVSVLGEEKEVKRRQMLYMGSRQIASQESSPLSVSVQSGKGQSPRQCIQTTS